MTEIAYRVKSEFADAGFEGGAVAVGELGETYHLGEALDAGNGYILTEDESALTIRLDDQPALERCEPAEARKAKKAAAKPTDEKKEG